MRREFVAAERKRREECRARLAADIARREERVGGQVEQQVGHDVAERIHDMPIIAPVADVGTDSAVGKPKRPGHASR